MSKIELKVGDNLPNKYFNKKYVKRIILTTQSHGNRIFIPTFKKDEGSGFIFMDGENDKNPVFISFEQGANEILFQHYTRNKKDEDVYKIFIELNDELKGYNTHKKSHPKTKFVCPEKMF